MAFYRPLVVISCHCCFVNTVDSTVVLTAVNRTNPLYSPVVNGVIRALRADRMIQEYTRCEGYKLKGFVLLVNSFFSPLDE